MYFRERKPGLILCNHCRMRLINSCLSFRFKTQLISLVSSIRIEITSCTSKSSSMHSALLYIHILDNPGNTDIVNHPFDHVGALARHLTCQA